MKDFDVVGAKWVDITTIGSMIYIEEIDVAHLPPHPMRHRRRGVGTEPHGPWLEGSAPTQEQK